MGNKQTETLLSCMKAEFSIITKVREYKAVLSNLTPDDHALLVHLKYLLYKEYENSELEDNIEFKLNVIGD